MRWWVAPSPLHITDLEIITNYCKPIRLLWSNIWYLVNEYGELTRGSELRKFMFLFVQSSVGTKVDRKVYYCIPSQLWLVMSTNILQLFGVFIQAPVLPVNPTKMISKLAAGVGLLVGKCLEEWRMRNEVACEEQSEKPFACGLVRLSTTQNSLMLAVVHHLKHVQNGVQFVAKN